MRLSFALFALACIAVGLNGAEKSRMEEISRERPVCNAANRGRLWPEGVTRPKGEAVAICSVSFWRYRWLPLTVDAAKLGRKGHRQEEAPPPAPVADSGN